MIEFRIITEDELGIKQYDSRHLLDLEEYNGEDSRINDLVDDIRILKDSDEMMEGILSLLTDTVSAVPQVGAYYTFIYQPKTPRIKYDRNPLIAPVSNSTNGDSKVSTITGVTIVTTPGRRWSPIHTLFIHQSWKTSEVFHIKIIR